MSLYDLPKRSWQVRQYGNPAIGERISTALAEPSVTMVAAEDGVIAEYVAKGSDTPFNAAPPRYAQRDWYRDMMDTASISVAATAPSGL